MCNPTYTILCVILILIHVDGYITEQNQAPAK